MEGLPGLLVVITCDRGDDRADERGRIPIRTSFVVLDTVRDGGRAGEAGDDADDYECDQ